jgi:hypothetical protein
MALKLRAAANTVHSGAEQKLKTSFEPVPKEARLTAISARIAPIPPDPPPSGVLGKTPHLRGFVFVDKCAAARPGRSLDWLKFKNPAAPAVKREAEEDWGR